MAHSNKNYLDSISRERKNLILKNVANHYGISIQEAEQEVIDEDAEMLYEYIANDASLRMSVYNDFKGNKFDNGGSVNTGRSWNLDRQKHNKSESWEKPMSKRKQRYDDGGGVDNNGEYGVSGIVWYVTNESAGDDYDQIAHNVLTKDEFDDFVSDGKIEKTHFDIKAKYDWQIRDKIYAEMAENDQERELDYEEGRHIIGYKLLLDNQDSGFGSDLPYEVEEDDDSDLEFRKGGRIDKYAKGSTVKGGLKVGDLVMLKADKNVNQVVDDETKDWSKWEKVEGKKIVGLDKKGRPIFDKYAKGSTIEDGGYDIIGGARTVNELSVPELEAQLKITKSNETERIKLIKKLIEQKSNKFAKGSTVKGEKSKIEITNDEEGRKIAKRTLVKLNSKGEKFHYELTVGLFKNRKKGWFEVYATDDDGEELIYSEGGIWIEGGKVVDYDGVYELNEKLKPLMSALNLNSSEVFNVFENGGGINDDDDVKDSNYMKFVVKNLEVQKELENYLAEISNKYFTDYGEQLEEDGYDLDTLFNVSVFADTSIPQYVTSFTVPIDDDINFDIDNSIEEKFGDSVKIVPYYYKSGGNVGRDRLFKSKQPHEQKYQRKNEWKEYKKEGWFGDWFANGGGVSYGDIKNEKQKMTDDLLKKCGVFFAFSNEQFDENKTPLKEGEKYVSIGGGGYMPKGNVDAFREGMKAIKQMGKKKVKENNLAETEILYELKNHECFYTGDYSDVVDMFKGTYTEKQIRDVYNKHREANQDFENGGGVGKVRMRLQDEGGFDEYLEEINFNFNKNKIEYEDSDIIIVSKDIADKFENDGVAYVLMGNELYKNGGGINSGRDLLFKSKQPHEQKYQRKNEWKEYKKEGWFGDWFADGGGVEDTIAERYARLTKAEAKRLDELSKKVRIDEQTESEDIEWDKLVHKYRGWEYKYANGGGVYNENSEMVINNNKQIRHHTEELSNIVTHETKVPAWVVAKVNRSASDLSDATHYLDGAKGKEYANGGTTMTNEGIVRDSMVNGEIHCDTLTEIIGHKPNYPHQIVGSLKLTKCYLKPYYKI